MAGALSSVARMWKSRAAQKDRQYSVSNGPAGGLIQNQTCWMVLLPTAIDLSVRDGEHLFIFKCRTRSNMAETQGFWCTTVFFFTEQELFFGCSDERSVGRVSGESRAIITRQS